MQVYYVEVRSRTDSTDVDWQRVCARDTAHARELAVLPDGFTTRRVLSHKRFRECDFEWWLQLAQQGK